MFLTLKDKILSERDYKKGLTVSVLIFHFGSLSHVDLPMYKFIQSNCRLPFLWDI